MADRLRRESEVYRGQPQRSPAERSSSSSDRPSIDRPSGDSSVAGRARSEAQERALVDELRAQSGELERVASGVLAVAEHLGRQANDKRQETVAESKRRLDLDLATAGNHGAQQLVEHRSKISDLAGSLAPGASGGDLSCAVGPTVPAMVRVGAAVVPAGAGTAEATEVPLLVPLLDSSNLIIETSSAPGLQRSDGCILNTVLRLLATVRAGDLVVYWYDPQLRGTLASLSRLHSGPTPVMKPAIADGSAFESVLGELSEDVARVTGLLGGRFPDLGSLERAEGESGEPYRLLVVSDFPSGLSERSAELLERLMRRGPACGVSVLLQHQRNLKRPDHVDVDLFTTLGSVLSETSSGAFRLAPFDNLPVSLDEGTPATLADEIAKSVAENAKSASAPTLPLAEVLEMAAAQGGSPGHHLHIPFGKVGTSLAEFTLGHNLDQLHNVLIGGAVGQGKSNVLLALIHALAENYSPDDVELFLLDFKEGLEFSSLAPGPTRGNGLPHAVVLGLESDRLYGTAVLRHVREEFDRRATAFKAVGASNLGAFRDLQPNAKVPRWVVVLDEFQVLLEEDDAVGSEALALLDTLARKGRAYGIHLVLASQTLSGITKLAVKEDSIFSQFPVRIALKTTPSESQVLLQRGNTEAARLRYRGEAILNTDSGAVDGNRRMTVAHAEENYCAAQIRRLNQSYPGRTIEVFRGSEPANLRDALVAPPNARPSTAVVGQPIGVARSATWLPLGDEPGRHLAIIGPASGSPQSTSPLPGSEALATLQAICLSLSMTAPCPSRFIFLDALSAEQQRAAALDHLAMALDRNGHHVEIVSRPDIPQALMNLRSELEHAAGDNQQTFVIGWGLHRAVGIDTPDPLSADRPIDALHWIVKDGPVLGVNLIGWWNSYKAYEQHIESNFSIAGIVQCFAFLQASQSEVMNVLGPFTEWNPTPNRLLLFDRAGEGAGSVCVPFGLQTGPDIAAIGGLT